MPACGDRNGYLAHRRRKEPACDPCLGAWRTYIAEYRKQNRLALLSSHTCIDCGVVWESSSKRAERCVSCANGRRSRGRLSIKSKELVHVGSPEPSNVCLLPPRHPAMRRPARSRLWYMGCCAHCGDTFVDIQPRTRYCSRACGSLAAKRRRGYFAPSPRVRSAIYERDGWICQLCMEPVDPALPSSDNWAPSLDHIRCQAWDELPDHSPSNLRLAHRWCNSVRGDETYYTAAVLVA